jgi:hypothetical protein
MLPAVHGQVDLAKSPANAFLRRGDKAQLIQIWAAAIRCMAPAAPPSGVSRQSPGRSATRARRARPCGSDIRDSAVRRGTIQRVGGIAQMR